MQNAFKAVLVLALAAAPAAVAAQGNAQGNEDGDAVLLIAKPELRDPEYRQTVLYVTPTSNDRHIGVIINRPTTRSLSSLFPEHEPSKKVIDPVFFGGPFGQSAVFAVVRAKTNPGGGSVALAKDLYFAARVDVVDKIIESTPNDARYYVGYVGWRPGELRQEIDRGLWYVIDADADLLFRKEPKGMWEELVRRARQLTAQAPYSGFVLALAR
ncbi:MAG: YqgE/AlgH family protein [Burkholderiales bacterium]|jgi:putative transcriptional regulator|nr:YqgE/AlgH family protein [Burkholderiales bacterium]